MVEGAIRVSKMAATRPRIWEDCVILARIWFEKYFNLKVCPSLFLKLNIVTVVQVLKLLAAETDRGILQALF